MDEFSDLRLFKAQRTRIWGERYCQDIFIAYGGDIKIFTIVDTGHGISQSYDIFLITKEFNFWGSTIDNTYLLPILVISTYYNSAHRAWIDFVI